MDSPTTIVVLPTEIKNGQGGYLIGDFALKTDLTKVFYVRGVQTTYSDKVVGYCNSLSDVFPKNLKRRWINIAVRDGNACVHSILCNDVKLNNDIYYFIKIFYKSSELDPMSHYMMDVNDDLVSHGGEILESLFNKVFLSTCTRRRNETVWLCVLGFVMIITWVMQWPVRLCRNITKYSTTGEHIVQYFDRFQTILTSYKEKKLTIQLKGELLRIVFDVWLGGLILLLLLMNVSLHSFPDMFLLTAENVVSSLRDLLHWLTGQPGGLKLNHAFNHMLATFFQFHIDIWWIFLVFLQPGLKAVFVVFMILGQFGISFQAAILADLLALVSFHVYCIYAYAARLYNIQLSGLVSLWRLFIGRKMNPFRQRVDSCSYTANQLFIGTLGFTILLFLLPTTLMYYVVFTIMRLMVVACGGLITYIRNFINTMPVYLFLLWLVNSPDVRTRLRLQVESTDVNSVTLSVHPVVDTWKATLCKLEQAQTSSAPTKLTLRQVLSNLFKGRLVYPVNT